MNDIKGLVLGMLWAFLTLLAPIKDFMLGMIILFGVNFLFGLVAARFNDEKWSWKKAGMFFVCCAIFFVTIASLFVVGHFLRTEEQAVTCVRYVCVAAMYLFTTNICRNWRNILIPGTPWYQLVDFIYYVLTFKFVDKIPLFKKYQEYRNESEKERKEP